MGVSLPQHAKNTTRSFGGATCEAASCTTSNHPADNTFFSSHVRSHDRRRSTSTSLYFPPVVYMSMLSFSLPLIPVISLLFSHGSAMGTFHLIYYILHLIPFGCLSSCSPDRHPKIEGMTYRSNHLLGIFHLLAP